MFSTIVLICYYLDRLISDNKSQGKNCKYNKEESSWNPSLA